MTTETTEGPTGRAWTQAEANEAAERALKRYIEKYPSEFVREMRRSGYSVDELARAMKIDVAAVRELQRGGLTLLDGGRE